MQSCFLGDLENVGMEMVCCGTMLDRVLIGKMDCLFWFLSSFLLSFLTRVEDSGRS